MASKRIAKSTVDWAYFARNVPQTQMTQFNAFKAKSDGYVAKVSMLPEALPAINWAQYEGRIAIPNMVSEFKKQYESISVSYPKDSYTTKIDEEEKVEMADVAQYIQQCQQRAAELKTELARVQSLMPIEEMNMEEFFDAYPDLALDPFDKPEMWPFTEEAQPEYVDQMIAEGKFDEDH